MARENEYLLQPNVLYAWINLNQSRLPRVRFLLCLIQFWQSESFEGCEFCLWCCPWTYRRNPASLLLSLLSLSPTGCWCCGHQVCSTFQLQPTVLLDACLWMYFQIVTSSVCQSALLPFICTILSLYCLRIGRKGLSQVYPTLAWIIDFAPTKSHSGTRWVPVFPYSKSTYLRPSTPARNLPSSTASQCFHHSQTLGTSWNRIRLLQFTSSCLVWKPLCLTIDSLLLFSLYSSLFAATTFLKNSHRQCLEYPC